MPNFRRILSRRRLLAVLGVAALHFGLAMLHPYPRQSLFGPTIRGKPWCYWEDQVRSEATRHRVAAKRSSFEKKIREWLGIRPMFWKGRSLFAHEEMLPLLVELTQDEDKDVRDVAIWAIVYYEELYDKPALPILREQLKAADPSRQIYAVRGVWRISKDRRLIPVVREAFNVPQAIRVARPGTAASIRSQALSVLAEMAREVPELFPEVVRFATGADANLRNTAMAEMQHFGKPGIEILLKGLNDPDPWVCLRAADTLHAMGVANNETVAALERLLRSDDTDVREQAVHALSRIDSTRRGDLVRELK